MELQFSAKLSPIIMLICSSDFCDDFSNGSDQRKGVFVTDLTQNHIISSLKTFSLKFYLFESQSERQREKKREGVG